MQGRVNSLVFAGLQGGPRLGDAEAGAVAALGGPAVRRLVRRPAQRGDRGHHLLGDPAILALPEHRRGWPGGAVGAPGQRAGQPGRARRGSGTGGPGLTRQS